MGPAGEDAQQGVGYKGLMPRGVGWGFGSYQDSATVAKGMSS